MSDRDRVFWFIIGKQSIICCNFGVQHMIIITIRNRLHKKKHTDKKNKFKKKKNIQK